MAAMNKQVLLANRPTGWVQESDFRIVDSPMPVPREGEMLIRTLFLSLDPYMRGRMSAARSYATPVDIGAVMTGGTVGEVIDSKHPDYKRGDIVVGYVGWQQYGVSDGRGLRKITPGPVPLGAYLGTVGMPGVTAWIGLLDIGQPKPGETVVVSAASGAVGSTVGQLAKIKGCRAVGIAGGKAKCDYVVNELGFDACVDYKAAAFERDLAAATPDGIDVYFENVGGAVSDAVLPRLNNFARIPLCGLIAQYNATEPHPIPDARPFLSKRIKLQGFICSDTMERWPDALDQLGRWVAEGRIKYRETIADGLENAPRAFIGMLKGENFGKQLVKVA
ncbi:MAG TPA: NADP-dependent oxidoreductase [Methylomirabilota bacterium]|nr:NADP-dependent oxidoreductase [Methylomirabilota bacterium]